EVRLHRVDDHVRLRRVADAGARAGDGKVLHCHVFRKRLEANLVRVVVLWIDREVLVVLLHPAFAGVYTVEPVEPRPGLLRVLGSRGDPEGGPARLRIEVAGARLTWTDERRQCVVRKAMLRPLGLVPDSANGHAELASLEIRS